MIFVTLGDAIIDSEEGTFSIFAYPKLLDVLLNCCNHPSYEVMFEIFLHFVDGYFISYLKTRQPRPNENDQNMTIRLYFLPQLTGHCP